MRRLLLLGALWSCASAPANLSPVCPAASTQKADTSRVVLITPPGDLEAQRLIGAQVCGSLTVGDARSVFTRPDGVILFTWAPGAGRARLLR